MWMAMVISVQHLGQMSAALQEKHLLIHVEGKQIPWHTSSISYVLPAAGADIIVVGHVDVKHELLLQSLEAPWLYSVVLVWLQVKRSDQLFFSCLHWCSEKSTIDPNLLCDCTPPRCRSCKGSSSASPSPARSACWRTDSAHKCHPWEWSRTPGSGSSSFALRGKKKESLWHLLNQIQTFFYPKIYLFWPKLLHKINLELKILLKIHISINKSVSKPNEKIR